MQFKKYLITLLLVLAIAPAYAVESQKEKDITKLISLMEVSGMPGKMAKLMASTAIAQERKRSPDTPKHIEKLIEKVVTNVAIKKVPDFFNMLKPLYNKYYTHSEIKGLIKFFKSPAGKKFQKVYEPMTQDIILIAQKWSHTLGSAAAKEVNKELKRYSRK